MPRWDSQTFAFQSYEACDVPLRLHSLALEGAVADLAIPTDAGYPVDVTGPLRLEVYEELEDHPLERWTSLVVVLETSTEHDGSLFLQTTCDATRLEQVIPAKGRPPTTLRIRTCDVRGRVLVRSLLAGRNGLVLGESRPIEIVVDRPSPMAGGGLRVEWNRDKFKDCPGALSVVDTLGAAPVLYLNAGIPDFYQLMNSHRRGVRGALRRHLLTQIEVDAWLALGAYVLRSLRDSELDLAAEDLNDEEITSALNDDCNGILRRLSELTGSGSPVEVVSRISDPSAHELVRTAVCSHVDQKPATLLEGLLTAIAKGQ